MGIKNLSKAIKKFAPGGRKEVASLAPYRGKRFAIDSAIFVHKFASLQRDVPTSMLEQATMLRAHGIHPIYVFDGRSCSAKQAEVKRRKDARDEAETAVEEAELVAEEMRQTDLRAFDNPLEAIIAAESKLQKSVKRVSSVPKKDDYTRTKEVLAAAGFEVRQACNDGEKACAWAAKRGLCDVVVTEDYDSLPYGSPVVLMGLGRPEMVEYDLGSILREMQMTMETFIDYCILCGCDLCPSKIRGVGMEHARRLLSQHHSIERVLQSLPKRFSVPPDFEFQCAREEFLDPRDQYAKAEV